MMKGEMPVLIDHEDGDALNNRWKNLREVFSQTESRKNSSMPKSNTSGHVGVYWYRNIKKWSAEIQFNNKKIHLGLFKDFDSAVSARKMAEKKYGFHPNHGKRYQNGIRAAR